MVSKESEDARINFHDISGNCVHGDFSNTYEEYEGAKATSGLFEPEPEPRTISEKRIISGTGTDNITENDVGKILYTKLQRI